MNSANKLLQDTIGFLVGLVIVFVAGGALCGAVVGPILFLKGNQSAGVVAYISVSWVLIGLFLGHLVVSWWRTYYWFYKKKPQSLQLPETVFDKYYYCQEPDDV
jgi:hypothetical protein